MRREKLSSDGIVGAAMALIDAEGEMGFSMRKLAAVLAVDPMAIYHHHHSKGALIHAVMQALMEDYARPHPTGDWRQDIQALCANLRALANRHPGTFRIYEVYEDWVTAEHHVQEAFHATLLSAGFSRKTTVRAARVLLAYTEAFAVDEIGGWTGAEYRAALAESLARGDFPITMGLIDEIVDDDDEADFAFGLKLILDGLEAELQAPSA